VGTVVLDAGVLIGWFDANDPHHATATAALKNEREHVLRLPASAYAEALVRHSAAGSVEAARQRIADVGITVDPVDVQGAEAAAAIRARHPSLRLPDALVLGHAEAIGADVVLTTDRRWKRVSPRVQVV